MRWLLIALAAMPAHADEIDARIEEVMAAAKEAPARDEPTRTADTIAVEAGVGRLWLADRASIAAHVALAFGVDAMPDLHIALRGNVVIGDGTVTTLGFLARKRLGIAFLDIGAGAARVHTIDVRGIGLAIDLGAGLRFGDITLAVRALPVWVFANDSLTMSVDSANELGLSLGFVR